ncbi:hypothetical protein DEO72_LG5g1366 [Vigna unguiculata]|uniref:Uncharacterized protein n=1 Tax=Vigna unguiculata TaxID=3917 RepID=A0A4D6LXT5_VIGUN|nr:hypothetical protein DEO72_LG5g1366 [Vigna unguiculata]
MVDFISAYFHWNEILSRLLLVQRTFLQRNLVSSKHGNVLQLLEFCRVFGKAKDAVRAFGPGYFRDSASVLEPRHIGARPKGTSFWPRLSPEAIASVFCLGSERTEAIASVSSSQWWLWLLLLFWLILAHRCSGADGRSRWCEVLPWLSLVLLQRTQCIVRSVNGAAAVVVVAAKFAQSFRTDPHRENRGQKPDAGGIFENLKTGLPYMLRFICNRGLKPPLLPRSLKTRGQKPDEIAKMPPPPYRLRKLKRYIKDENSRYAKGVKEAKLKIDATKEKVKCLERKLWNEKAKVVSSTVSPFPMEEKIRTEVDEAHADMLSKFSKRKQHSDIKIEDETATSPEESWSVYSPAEISKYISSR